MKHIIRHSGLWLATIVAAVVISNFCFTWTIYNPSFAVPAYRWAGEHGLLKFYDKVAYALNASENTLYPEVSIARIDADLFWESHALVKGQVTDVIKADDGDWHINLSDGQGHTLVLEIAPEFPLKPPVIGQRISAWGLTRYDIQHRWWEIHPVFGWKP